MWDTIKSSRFLGSLVASGALSLFVFAAIDDWSAGGFAALGAVVASFVPVLVSAAFPPKG